VRRSTKLYAASTLLGVLTLANIVGAAMSFSQHPPWTGIGLVHTLIALVCGHDSRAYFVRARIQANFERLMQTMDELIKLARKIHTALPRPPTTNTTSEGPNHGETQINP
jgi:hypothetical protein